MSAPSQENVFIDTDINKGSIAPAAGYASVALAAQKILQEEDVSRIVFTICEEACRLLGGDASVIQQIDAKTDARLILASHRVPEKYLKIMRGARGDTLLGLALKENKLGRVEVIQEPAQDRRIVNPAGFTATNNPCVVFAQINEKASLTI